VPQVWLPTIIIRRCTVRKILKVQINSSTKRKFGISRAGEVGRRTLFQTLIGFLNMSTSLLIDFAACSQLT